MEREYPDLVITSDLARAARALSQVSVVDIAERAHLTPEQVREFERHQADLSAAQKTQLQQALEHFGVVFLPDDDQGGYGVRRKFTQTKVKRLENWENEGGPAYEDDI